MRFELGYVAAQPDEPLRLQLSLVGHRSLERLTSLLAARPVDFLDLVHTLLRPSLKQGDLRLAAEVFFGHLDVGQQISLGCGRFGLQPMLRSKPSHSSMPFHFDKESEGARAIVRIAWRPGL